MLRVSTFATLVALAVGSMPAIAADLPDLPPLEPAVPVAVGGGWYLRGDVGLGSSAATRPRTPTVNLVPVDTALVRQRIDESWSLGGGAGYRFSPMFRADVTVQGISARHVNAIGIDQGFPVSTQSAAYYRGDLRSTVALANAYWDIGTFSGFTPFIGAGVGVAYNRLGKIGRADVAAPLTPAIAYDSFARGGRSNVAYALYAGLAYEITPGVTAEVAYRYLNVGQASSKAAMCGDTFNCVSATPLRVKDISSQDVTLGVRWDLGGV